MIDWFSEKTEVLFNPRMPEIVMEEMIQAAPLLDRLESHVCFSTSGTTGKLKWVVLSKHGILSSAKAVNEHLGSDHNDIWLNPLPEFHVGGVGIQARGYLSGAEVIDCHFPDSKWNPIHFHKQLQVSRATLTALVPTQVFDLVSAGLEAPTNLRAVVVGGGALSEQLYFAAVRLGWRLLPSYGLTECASQVATAKYGSWNLEKYPLLEPLNHISCEQDESGHLKIKSEALLTAYLFVSENGSWQLHDPKCEGWFITEDKAEFEGGGIKSIHRGEHFVKIGGESVDLLRLEKILEEVKLATNFQADLALAAMQDDRLGHCLCLAVCSPIDDNVYQFMDKFHHRVFPFERVRHVVSVEEIPRSPLNKVLKTELDHEIRSKLDM